MCIIDRFEGDTALWEGGHASRSLLPMAAREGDVLHEDDKGGYYVDLVETKRRKDAMQTRLSALFSKQ
ncbi:MAG: DUF3006 domain-containing protein [Clostridia bacterium]|nr:DUF3006 domain-containing protein [Candidatus Pelethousia sp.]NCB29789.1 DUF3006 domain-containing protein [Clostridia bacterium]